MSIIELAHEAGYGDIEAWLDDESMPFLERFAALVRAEALEEAAKVCESIEPSWRRNDVNCAEAIRNLK